MNETPQQPGEEPNAGETSYEWKGADTTSGAAEEGSEERPGPTGRVWLDQLQSMIDDLATQAAPVVRQVGVKAAELAVLAGEKAGPIAHRAAEATETAGIRLAERSRQFADDLRRQQADAGGGQGGQAGEGAAAEPAATEPGTDDEPDGA